jgi:ADP-ribose pyrophosphatase YjhB (NUDIX family)
MQSMSSGAVVINKEGKVLLVDEGGIWSLPKGHVEDGEGLMDTAKREITEESGLNNLEYVMNLGNYKRNALDNPEEIKNIFMFLFKTPENDLKPVDSDIKEARWVTREEAATLLTHPKDKEFFEKVNPILEV